MRLQSNGSRVGDGVAQQLAGIGRLDGLQRRGRLEAIEKRLEVLFLDFPEKRVLDAVAIGVEQEGAEDKRPRPALADQDDHPRAELEHLFLHQAGMDRPPASPTHSFGEAAPALGRLGPASFRQ